MRENALACLSCSCTWISVWKQYFNFFVFDQCELQLIVEALIIVFVLFLNEKQCVKFIAMFYWCSQLQQRDNNYFTQQRSQIDYDVCQNPNHWLQPICHALSCASVRRMQEGADVHWSKKLFGELRRACVNRVDYIEIIIRLREILSRWNMKYRIRTVSEGENLGAMFASLKSDNRTGSGDANGLQNGHHIVKKWDWLLLFFKLPKCDELMRTRELVKFLSERE